MATHNALGEFLVARRSALRPEDVGMARGNRRRTPGLRREEVAVRAGVSADYLARLEQGRDTNPSVAVVDALCDALLLNHEERHHLNLLAMVAGNEAHCPGAESEETEIPTTIRTVLDALQPTPAFVLGRRLNVLGWNQAWERFARPLGVFGAEETNDGELPNLAWYVFVNPTSQRFLRNWDEAARLFSAALSAASSHWPRDEALAETIERLRRFPTFADRWLPHQVSAPVSGTLRFDHPILGATDVPFETLRADRDQSIAVWLLEQANVGAPDLRLVRDHAG